MYMGDARYNMGNSPDDRLRKDGMHFVPALQRNISQTSISKKNARNLQRSAALPLLFTEDVAEAVGREQMLLIQTYGFPWVGAG